MQNLTKILSTPRVDREHIFAPPPKFAFDPIQPVTSLYTTVGGKVVGGGGGPPANKNIF